MKTIIFFSLFFFLPIFLSAQDEEQDEKITCGSLIQDHMSQCEKCRYGNKCYTRNDLLKFCSNQDQEVMIIDSGAENCGCPTYGYYGNYYQSSSYGDYDYNGPSYRVGFGFSVGASYPVRGSYNTGSYHHDNSHYKKRWHYSNDGYNYNGTYYRTLDFNPKYKNNYHNSGSYYHKGHYNNQGSHHSQGSSNYQGHYGSRPHSRRGG